MTSRILIVTDDASLQALIGQAMAGSGYERLLATSGTDALRRWTSEGADLLIVDTNVAGLDGITLTERIRAAEGGQVRVPIVLVGGSDPRAKLRGLRAGADDYLTVPVHPVELMARIRRLVVVRPPPRAAEPEEHTALGQVLAFYGAKGGVGTTTLAVNTAVALRRLLSRRVALVDANLQFGDHRVFLDVGNDRRSIIDAVTAPAIDGDLLSQVMIAHESGVEALLAPPSPDAADHVSAERHHLLQIVEVLRTHYDYVVVDLAQELDDHSLDVVGVADRVLVVMNADLSCIKNVRLVMETMAQVGVPADRLHLLMNRSNAMTGVSAKSVEAVLKRQIEYFVVNDYRAAITALNTGKPFMMGKADASIVASVTEMIRRIDAGPREHAAAPARGSGLRALTAGTASR
jgi:pilus assembly protein CpaE